MYNNTPSSLTKLCRRFRITKKREDYQGPPSRLASVKCCDATHGHPVGTVVVVRVGVAIVEVQVPGVAAILRTTPVVAVVAPVVQRAIAVVPVAGRRQKAGTCVVTRHRVWKEPPTFFMTGSLLNLTGLSGKTKSALPDAHPS